MKNLRRVAARKAGYTLLELLITISVAVILLAIAAPNLAEWVQNARITSETDRMVALLNYSRTEALSRNKAVTLDTELAAGDWSGNISVYTDETHNTTFNSSTDTMLREVTADKHGLTINGDGRAGNWISFDSLGRLAEDGRVAQIAVCDRRGKEHGKVITINLLGQIRVEAASALSSGRLSAKTCRFY